MKTKRFVHRTIRVDLEYWDAIIRHFKRCPDGTKGSDIIRRAIRMIGQWCLAREEAGIAPDYNTADEALGIVFSELQQHMETSNEPGRDNP